MVLPKQFFYVMGFKTLVCLCACVLVGSCAQGRAQAGTGIRCRLNVVGLAVQLP